MTALLPPHSGTTFHDALMGDVDALDALLARHRSAVEAVCFRRLRSRVDAEDAVQETMAKGMRSLEYVEDPSRLRSYLCRIAERVCLDMLRDGARAMPAVIEDTAPTTATEDNPEEAALDRERAELVHRTLQALNERQATALWMRDAMGESVPTVAEHLGVTEGSARVLLTRARAKMREGWAKVAAIFPAGFGLPGVASKVIAIGPLAIPVAVPAALVAVIAIASPVALRVLSAPEAVGLAPQQTHIQKAPATTTTPVPAPSAATTTEPIAAAPAPASAPASATGGVAGVAPGVTRGEASVPVGNTTFTTVDEPATPEDDDFSLGNDDLIELGAQDPEGLVGAVVEGITTIGG